MKRLFFILVLGAICLSACVHEDSTDTTAYAGGSVNPAWPSDSARNTAIRTGTGPTGLTKNPDTIPKGFTPPVMTDTSQRKKF
jgi:hypothetical protein